MDHYHWCGFNVRKKTKSAGDIGGSIRDVQHNLTVTEFGGVLATTEALPHIFTLQL